MLQALRTARLVPELLDSYLGPADLRAQVDEEPPVDPGRLRKDASALLARVSREVAEPPRARWLTAQLVALESQAMCLSGDPLPYADCVACCFDMFPEQTPEAEFANAADDLRRLLPARPSETATVVERLTAWDRRFEVDPARLAAVIAWLVGVFRERTSRLFGLPDGEEVEIQLVTGQPRPTAYRHEPGGRSVVGLDRGLPLTVPELVRLVAREAYPGNHAHSCAIDRVVVDELGRAEAALVPVNTPARLIGEGMAELAERLVAPDDDLADLLVEAYTRAGLRLAADPVAARDAAERQARIRRVMSVLKAVPGNAAFMLHAEGAPHEEVAGYLERYLLTTRERAAHVLAAIEHPVRRTFAFAGFQGERLLRHWFDLVSDAELPGRYDRLVREQLTPRQLKDELVAAGFGPSRR